MLARGYLPQHLVLLGRRMSLKQRQRLLLYNTRLSFVWASIRPDLSSAWHTTHPSKNLGSGQVIEPGRGVQIFLFTPHADGHCTVNF